MEITADLFKTLILKSNNFVDYIINNYPELEADIKSYRLDVNCSCRHKITKFFEFNIRSMTTHITKWLSENPTVGLISTELSHRNVLKTSLPVSEQDKYKDVIGDIVEIAPDPMEYKKIIAIAREEWLYNGINILETVKLDPQTKKESVVWLLLFY
jgi:hypothetical protein